MPDLLLELFSEEIPARMQARAGDDLARMMNERLIAAGYLPEGVKAFVGPRRLTLVATGLPLRQADRKEEKKGPRVGAPQGAIDGFLKSAGLASLDQCAIEEDKKGQYYIARLDRPGRATADVIAETVPDIVRNFPWPKSMRWGASERNGGDLAWVRPLKSVLCCFDNEIVPFAIDGLAAGDETRGHRAAGGASIRARNFDNYAAALAAAKVVLDADARRQTIAADARTLCEAQGLELVEDKGLLAEVAGLAEWPVVMIGAFDAKFLALPDEVLTAVMRGHQKYFSVRSPETGRLAPKFVFVANIEAADGGASMRRGYERVLTARLSDAWYLYQLDLKRPLEDRITDLDRVTFFEGLGSIGDKARRVAALAKEIAPAVGADPLEAEQAGLLAKADLTTGMVYEFPELQGIMGRYYFLAQRSSPASAGLSHMELNPLPLAGEGRVRGRQHVPISQYTAPHPRPLSRERERGEESGGSDAIALPASGGAEAIADAIRDHYLPKGADDAFPTAPVSVVVALADKIDTLTAFWAIGKKPTGSGDPFALRRAALGIISMLENSGQSINPLNQIGWLLTYHHEIPPSEPRNAEIQSDLLEFFHDRMKVYFQTQGHRHDHVAAALIGAGGRPESVPYQIARKLKAFAGFMKTEDGANLAAGYKRAANILKAEEKKGALPGAAAFSEAALQQAEERQLHSALVAAESTLRSMVVVHNYNEAMTLLSTLRSPIDAFFVNVTVNADEPALRANRLALLQRFIAATATVADLSKLEG